MRWNEATWYSRLGSLIFFLGILPAGAFYLGFRYQELNTVAYAVPAITSVPSHVSNEAVETPDGKISEDGYYYEISYKTDAVKGSAVNDSLWFVSRSGTRISIPDSIWFKISSGTAFEKTGKSYGENITSFTMPQDPHDPNIIYLSTSDYNYRATTTHITNRLYTFNLKTLKLTELYSETVPTEQYTAPIFRTVARDGSKIILLLDQDGNSPGPCSNIWYRDDQIAPREMEYFDINDMQAGLKPYTIPQYKVEEAVADVKECTTELKKNWAEMDS